MRVGGLWWKVVRKAVIGAGLVLCFLWMVFYAGLLKKSYFEANADRSHQSWYSKYAHDHWPSIEWLGNEHPVLWEVAPLFPPEMTGRTIFAWSFVGANWLLLCWAGIFYGGLWSWGSATYLYNLMGEVRGEIKRDEIRQAYGGGGSTGPGPWVNFRAEIEVRTAESGKWWSLNGVIVGGCIAAVLAQAISVLIGLVK